MPVRVSAHRHPLADGSGSLAARPWRHRPAPVWRESPPAPCPGCHRTPENANASDSTSWFRLVSGGRLMSIKHHIRARNHQRTQLAVVQAEHIAHHFVLVLFDHPGFRSPSSMAWISSVTPVGVLAHAEQAQQGGVEKVSSMTNGRVHMASSCIGLRRQPGNQPGLIWPRRWAPTEPRWTHRSPPPPPPPGGQMGAGPGRPIDSSQRASGRLTAPPSPTMPFSRPIEVMPI